MRPYAYKYELVSKLTQIQASMAEKLYIVETLEDRGVAENPSALIFQPEQSEKFIELAEAIGLNPKQILRLE